MTEPTPRHPGDRLALAAIIGAAVLLIVGLAIATNLASSRTCQEDAQGVWTCTEDGHVRR